MKKINYIIAFYLGDRMHPLYTQRNRENKFYFIEKHIEFLNKGTDIDLTTFVINIHDHSMVDELIKKIKTYKINFPLEIILRENKGFSYGAWNDVINKNIDDFEYFFINEDDYIPSSKDFYQPFIEKISDTSPYICVMISMEPKKHASFSCGLLKGQECRKVFSKHNQVFKIISTDVYKDAYINQINFYDYFTDNGYKMEDLIHYYQLPYMDSSKNSITYYGDKNNPTVLTPIDFELYI